MLAVGAYEESSAATGVGGDPTSDAAPAAVAAYVFTRGATAWTQAAFVKASRPGAGDSLGAPLALSGDASTLVAGAPNEASSETDIDGEETADTSIQPGAASSY